MARLPMFPLGSVVLPHQSLSLHVFEPRYRSLVRDCLAGDRTFGVVLIERGSEVGGGDTRFGAGCIARIVEAEETPDGRWGLRCLGAHRIRVVEWLPDDPYPVAEVEVRGDGPWTPDASAALTQALGAFRRVLALAVELGGQVDPGVLDLPEDPLVGHWLLAARAPIADLDKLRILSADTAERRLDLLAAGLVDLEAMLASRLSGG